MVMVTPADLHDAAAAKEVLFRLRLMLGGQVRLGTGREVEIGLRGGDESVSEVGNDQEHSGFFLPPALWPGRPRVGAER